MSLLAEEYEQTSLRPNTWQCWGQDLGKLQQEPKLSLSSGSILSFLMVLMATTGGLI